MFYLFDWKDDFFSLLYSYVSEKTNNTYEDSVLIFPTSRAKHICLDYFRQRLQVSENSYAANFLPQCLTIEEWLDMSQLFWQDRQVIEAKQIDSLESIFILYEVVKNLAKSRSKASEKNFFASLLGNEERKKTSFFHSTLNSFVYFYSYGEFLHKIIQECFEENTMAISLKHLSNSSDEVEDFIAYLLSNIRSITNAYIEELRKNNKTTKAFSKFSLAKKLEENKEELSLFYQDKSIFFCGLDRLTNTEEVFLKYYLQTSHKAEVKGQSVGFIFCSDPLLASDKDNAHWSCAQYSLWAQRWGQDFKLYTRNTKNLLAKQVNKSKKKQVEGNYSHSLLGFEGENQDFYFHKAFDTHSQFQDLSIDTSSMNKKVACVLNTEDSLLPLLYNLYPKYTKDDELNITMGYALKHSKIAQFLNSLATLKANKRDYVNLSSQSYLINSSDLIEFISFPFFAKHIHEARSALLQSQKAYIDPFDFFEESSEEYRLCKDILHTFISINTLKSTSEFIYALAKHCKAQLNEHAIERLALLRLEAIAQNWEQREYKDEEMSFELCFNLLIDEIESEHLAFAHHSDTALQVMGLLETKLLSFDTVHIFDANEEFLPQKASDNPLLPERLRPQLGLLRSHEKELYYAHTWYRLIASAKQVHIYWQEASAKGLLESKKTASSYVEEIIWKVEQKNKALLDEKSKEFSQALCPIEINSHENFVINSPLIKSKISDLLEKGISASKLDTFLSCPLRFFYENVCSFSEESEVQEAEDNAALGTFVHEFMHKLYLKGEVEKYDLQNMLAKELYAPNAFEKLLEDARMYDNFPPESMLLLKHSFPYRMQKYVEEQPDKTFVLETEKKLKAELTPKAKLVGVVDRIDKRIDEQGNEECIVLDYKSFSIINKVVTQKFWEMDDFFDTMQELLKNFDEKKAKELVEVLYSNTQSVQLFVYIYLAYKNRYRVTNAAYIDLYESCEEKKIIFDDNNENDVIENKIPLILQFLVKYLQEITCFCENEHSKCDWCSFKKYCI